MSVDKDITTELFVSEVDSVSTVSATDITNLMERVNAQYEAIMDDDAPGGSQTVDGHCHGAEGEGRGIARSVVGWFKIYGTSLSRTASQTLEESLAKGYSSYYPSALNSACPNNYVIGQAYVSPGVEEIQVEMSAAANASNAGALIRVKNCTDTAAFTALGYVGSEWIEISNTSTAKWFGPHGGNPTTVFKVPVEKSSAGRMIELDIEVCKTLSSAVIIEVAEAFAYEVKDER